MQNSPVVVVAVFLAYVDGVTREREGCANYQVEQWENVTEGIPGKLLDCDSKC